MSSIPDNLRRHMQARIDAQITQAIYGTATTAQPPQEPLTIDKLRRMMAGLPPRETWLSSRLFPSDSAFCVSGPGENFTCAHPSFWLRAEDALRKSAEVKPASLAQNPLGMNLTPIEIDPWPEDSEATAKWRAAHWDRLREAFEVAMTPLPEWLRSPPKFGKHG